MSQQRIVEQGLEQKFEEVFRREFEKSSKAAREQVESLQKEKRSVERKIFNLVRTVEDGMEAPQVRNRMDALQSRLADLDAQLSAASSTINLQPLFLSRPSLPEMFKILMEADPDIAAFSEAKEAFRGLIDRIEIGSDRIDIFLSALGLLRQVVRVRKSSWFEEQIKVVAGACNHREPNSLVVAV